VRERVRRHGFAAARWPKQEDTLTWAKAMFAQATEVLLFFQNTFEPGANLGREHQLTEPKGRLHLVNQTGEIVRRTAGLPPWVKAQASTLQVLWGFPLIAPC